MKLEVLDTKEVNGKTWALCKGNLLQYLNALKTDFFEFSVQRKIVNNVYLDNIYLSVEKGEPFPPITLTYSENISLESKGKLIDIDEDKIEILDGLQRTYRLWVIVFFQKLIESHKVNDLRGLAEAAKSTPEGEVVLQNRFITPKFIKSFFAEQDGKLYINKLIDSYSKFDIYFNIWTGLDDKTVIRRMLVLNAGQKSVSSTHQFELLFLHFFEDDKLKYSEEVTLVREKDIQFRDVQRGARKIGEYLMSSIVIALQSFINGKQLRISPTNMINLDDNKLLNDEILVNYFNAHTLSEFINHLHELGKKLSEKSDRYVKWFGKDTTLSGVFGAMGAYLKETIGQSDVDGISNLMEKFESVEDPFMLNDYYDAYENKLATTKVNVGNAVRKAIFNYTKDFLTQGESDWYKHFSQQNNYGEE